MRITEDLVFKAELIKKIAEREFSERTGVHCSDLCYCLNKQALRRLHPLPLDEHEILLFSQGWATQRWLTGMLTDAPHVEVDGIKVTCDALVPAGDIAGKSTPWELKATFQSSEKVIEENTAWLHQIMAQCYVMVTTEAYLTRLELMGNWGSVFPKGATKEEREAYRNAPEQQKPTLHAYHLVFTKDELDDNWEWLKARRTLFLSIERDGYFFRLPKGLALPQGQDWECRYCSDEYKKQCEEEQCTL